MNSRQLIKQLEADGWLLARINRLVGKGVEMRFPVVLHTDDGVRYGVIVPDIKGCFSAGDSFESALDSVVETIDLHLEGLAEEGAETPLPRSIAYHQGNPDFADGVWALVDVDVAKYDGRTEKVNITLPRRLLAKIDDYAKRHHQTRSGFLAEAARAAMK